MEVAEAVLLAATLPDMPIDGLSTFRLPLLKLLTVNRVLIAAEGHSVPQHLMTKSRVLLPSVIGRPVAQGSQKENVKPARIQTITSSSAAAANRTLRMK